MITPPTATSRSVPPLASLVTVVLSACAPQNPSADYAELNNMWRVNLVPKSEPYQVTQAFDRYCTNGPRDAKAADAKLRTAGYVPLPRKVSGITAYVIDNERPAVAVSSKMCVVQAESRSGQTARFQNYVAKTYPAARAIDPKSLGDTIEQAWSVPSDPPAIIATERTESFGWYRYALILYTPGAA